MAKLKIEYVPIDSLKPYEGNARQHTQKDIDTIKASINEFGFLDPVGVWSDENIIVEGHGRVLASKELGMSEVPIIRLDYLTDEERKAYALAHNKTAEMSNWDFEQLESELAEIGDIDMEQFGFDPQVMDFNWDEVDDLEEDTYKEPQTKKLRCPNCNHVDNAGRFLKVE